MKLIHDRLTNLTPDPAFLPLSNLLSVSSGECKWPGEGLECCGRLARAKDAPYCEHHHAIAHGKRIPNLADETVDRMHCAGMRRMSTTISLMKLATAEELGL